MEHPVYAQAQFKRIPDGTTPSGTPADFDIPYVPMGGAFSSLESDEVALHLMKIWQTQPTWMATPSNHIMKVIWGLNQAGKEHWLTPGILVQPGLFETGIEKGLNELMIEDCLGRENEDGTVWVWPTERFLNRISKFRVTPVS